MSLSSSLPSSTSKAKAKEVAMIDSLPYIDYFPEDYETYALSLIEEEMTKFTPSDYLGHIPPYKIEPSSLGPLSRLEYDALVARNGLPRPVSNEDNYPFTSVPMPPPPSLEENDNSASWKNSINQAKIYHEQLRSRLLNLELSTIFESGQWSMYNTCLDEQFQLLSSAVQKQRQHVDSINARRKQVQEKEVASTLRVLGERYYELVGRNQRLSNATFQLEEEVKRMRAVVGVRTVDGSNSNQQE